MNEDEKADRDVKAFIQILKRDYEIDLMDLRDDLRRHDIMRRFAFIAASAVIGTLVLALISGIGTLLYAGIKYYVGIE
jgi:hypothetical protein